MARFITLFLNLCDKLKWLAPLLARLTLAGVFIQSGWGKIHDLPDIVKYFTDLGIPFPELQAPLVAWSELICGALMLLGLLTRLAGIPLSVMMTVAIITAKKEEIHSVTSVFNFVEFLYIVLAVWLVIEGPGPIAVDRLLRRQKS
jgi:putative oxidoreductase